MRSRFPSNPLPEYTPSIYSAFVELGILLSQPNLAEAGRSCYRIDLKIGADLLRVGESLRAHGLADEV